MLGLRKGACRPASLRAKPSETQRSAICAITPFLAFLGLISLCFTSGCTTGACGPWVKQAHYRPDNVYHAASRLPADLRRIAVLPISVEPNDWQAEAGLAQLQPVLQTELGKAKRFELVFVPAEQLQVWTGGAAWRSDEVLPADFFERLQNHLDCDAVLFTHVRPYHAYPPLVLGWTFKLVHGQTKQALWSADEVFDASQEAVANAARSYSRRQNRATGGALDGGTILDSPRQFAHYTLGCLLATLPSR